MSLCPVCGGEPCSCPAEENKTLFQRLGLDTIGPPKLLRPITYLPPKDPFT